MIGLDGHKHRHAHAQLFAVEQAHLLADDALLGHLLDALPAGSGRQADAFRNLVDRERGVFLQEGKNAVVFLVHGGVFSSLLFEKRIIFPFYPISGFKKKRNFLRPLIKSGHDKHLTPEPEVPHGRQHPAGICRPPP